MLQLEEQEQIVQSFRKFKNGRYKLGFEKLCIILVFFFGFSYFEVQIKRLKFQENNEYRNIKVS